jgi:hypothetical protein
MNGKLLDLKITKKKVEMENKLLSKSKSYTGDTGKKDRYGNAVREWIGESRTMSYKSFTKSEVEFVDATTNEAYQVNIIEDDFLPVFGSTIKTYVGDDKTVLAYQPYRAASPVVLYQNFPDYTPSKVVANFITGLVFAVPVIPIVSVFGLQKACEKYKDGRTAKRFLLNILLMMFLVSFQAYFTFFLYENGRHYFWEAMTGYLCGGTVLAAVLALSDFHNMLNLRKYQMQIKRRFK